MARLDPQALVTHLDRLYRVAWALCGSREEAEDLVQETAARVLAKPRQLHGQDELAYLVRALRNTFLLARRTRSRRPQEVATLDQVEPVQRHGTGLPEVALEARELFAAIATLPDDFRHALVAVDVAGLSYREAAELLDTREATVASRLFRARERVASALVPPADAGEGNAPARSLR
ncbi:MAG: RNA polymerase sigma factor [Actinobacteria bacterium]|nr:RNA polymerase sigma factor [Actinomycetota bacterium]